MIALVTGASRGAGRGIAVSLGEVGATVYVTGRSSRATSRTEDLAGAVEDTADEVTRRGGRGIAIRCDHTVDAEVEAAFAGIEKLDLLVNNAWGGYEREPHGLPQGPYEQQPLDRNWRLMFESGLRAAFKATQLAVPKLSDGGMIVNTVAWVFDEFLGNVFYDVVKTAMIRMAFDLSVELKPRKITVVALALGFTRTERVMAAHAKQPFDISRTESPEYCGRAVAALLKDPNRLSKSGGKFAVGDLAREYGFFDIDGTQPEAFRFSK